MITAVKIAFFIVIGGVAGIIVCAVAIPVLLGLLAASILQIWREKKGYIRSWEEPKFSGEEDPLMNLEKFNRENRARYFNSLNKVQ